MRRRRTADHTRVVTYTRVSTEEQAVSGLGLEAQQAAILAAALSRGWTVVASHVDAGISGSVSPTDRPGLAAALDAVATGAAGALVVAKLDRLSRSLLNMAQLMDRSSREGWAMVILDLGLDTTTPQGEVMAAVLAAISQFERRLIGERTRVALAAARARGQRLGRPVELAEATRRHIVELREEGKTMDEVAAILSAEGVPTARGGQWARGTVGAVLRSVALDRLV